MLYVCTPVRNRSPYLDEPYHERAELTPKLSLLQGQGCSGVKAPPSCGPETDQGGLRFLARRTYSQNTVPIAWIYARALGNWYKVPGPLLYRGFIQSSPCRQCKVTVTWRWPSLSVTSSSKSVLFDAPKVLNINHRSVCEFYR